MPTSMSIPAWLCLSKSASSCFYSASLLRMLFPSPVFRHHHLPSFHHASPCIIPPGFTSNHALPTNSTLCLTWLAITLSLFKVPWGSRMNCPSPRLELLEQGSLGKKSSAMVVRRVQIGLPDTRYWTIMIHRRVTPCSTIGLGMACAESCMDWQDTFNASALPLGTIYAPAPKTD